MGYFDDDILDYGYSSWGDTGAEGDDDYTYAPVVEERGFFGDVRTSALRGLSQLSESAWRGAELLPVVGKKIDEADIAEGIAERREQSPWMAQDMSEFQGDEGLVKRGVTGMVEALPTSIGPAAAGAAVGTALLPGLGTAAGAAIGAGLGTLGFFTASEGRRAYKEGIEQGMAEDEAFWYGAKKGGAEGGLEAGAMALDILIPFSGKITKGVRMSRKAAKEALEAEGKEATTTAIAKLRGQAKEPQSIGEYLKGTDWRTHRNNMVGIMGTENLTEQAQLELGAAIDRQHGLEGEVTWEERKETIAVTTWMSLLFGGLGAGVNVNERNKLKKGLESKNPEVRNAAAEQFRGLLPEERQADFDEVWGDVRENNTPFVISQDISDRAKEVHEETLMASAAQMGGLPDGITVTERVKANKAQEAIVSKPIAESAEVSAEVMTDHGMPKDVVAPAAESVSSGIAQENVEVGTAPASTAIKPGANRQAEVQAQASVAPQEAVAVTKTEVQATAPAAGGAGGGRAIATPGPAATPGVQEQPVKILK